MVAQQQMADVLPFAAGTEGVNLQMAQLIETLHETNVHLKSISEVGSGTLKFVKQGVPWIVALASILWPTVGKVISGLPPLPG